LPAGGARAGAKLEVPVYFRAVRRPSADFQMQLVVWPVGGAAPPAKSPAKMAGGGLLPTSRWRDGELIRERMKLKLPDGWPAGQMQVGLRLAASGGKTPTHTGPSYPKEADVAVLGAGAVAGKN